MWIECGETVNQDVRVSQKQQKQEDNLAEQAMAAAPVREVQGLVQPYFLSTLALQSQNEPFSGPYDQI